MTTSADAKVIAEIQRYAEDQMWADHAEVPKALLRSAIRLLQSRAPATAGWRTIDSAPRDGTRIVIAKNMGEPWGWVRGIGGYERARGIEGWIAFCGFNDVPGVLGLAEPTHWQPLPEPPSPITKTEG